MHRHSSSGKDLASPLLLLREEGARAMLLCCGTEPQCLRKQRLNGLSRRKVSWEVNTLHTPRVTSSTVTFGKYSVSYRRPRNNNFFGGRHGSQGKTNMMPRWSPTARPKAAGVAPCSISALIGAPRSNRVCGMSSTTSTSPRLRWTTRLACHGRTSSMALCRIRRPWSLRL